MSALEMLAVVSKYVSTEGFHSSDREVKEGWGWQCYWKKESENQVGSCV